MDSVLIYSIRLPLEFLIVMACTVYRADKKPLFALRLLLSCAASLLLSPLFEIVDSNTLLGSAFIFLLMYLAMVSMSCFCFRLTLKTCFYYAAIAYNLQHMNATFAFALAIIPGSPFMGYSSVLSLLIYGLMYLLLRKRIFYKSENTLSRFMTGALVFITLLVSIVLSDVVRLQNVTQTNILYQIMFFVLDILAAAVLVAFQVSLLQRLTLENELAIIHQLYNREKQQYEMTRDVMEAINVKCHDMRHQIRHLGAQVVVDPSVLRDMEQSISFYDLFIKTGNRTLDTIMAEKGLFCQSKEINISCIADGQALDFMSEADIASLFGNMLDNAIHAVTSLEKEKRTITLMVRAAGSLLSINSHNYCSEVPLLVNGLPQTSQADNGQHGFGVRSMKMIVEKYNGTISFKVKEGVFNVNILIPLIPSSKGE